MWKCFTRHKREWEKSAERKTQHKEHGRFPVTAAWLDMDKRSLHSAGLQPSRTNKPSFSCSALLTPSASRCWSVNRPATSELTQHLLQAVKSWCIWELHTLNENIISDMNGHSDPISDPGNDVLIWIWSNKKEKKTAKFNTISGFAATISPSLVAYEDLW